MKIKLKIFLIYIVFLISISVVTALLYFLGIFNVNFEDNILIIIITISISLIIPLIITLIISVNLAKEFKQLVHFLKNFFLNKKFPEKLVSKSGKKDEFGLIYKELSTLISHYITYSEFAENLKGNNLNADLQINNNDRLGLSLHDIKENLITTDKEHKLNMLQLERNNWYQSGVTEFTVLLQQDFKSSEEMAYPVIKKLAQHLEAEQAGIFVLKNKGEKELLILEAAYAYDKKKQLDTELELGESLVGKCAEEMKLIRIDDLPEGYTYISSGLGEDTPKSLILMPLIYEKRLYGVIEIASLKRIADYKINFLNVIAERVAAEISNINTKILTSKLAEDYKKQSEELALKEQNTEKQISELEKHKEKLIAENKNIIEDFKLIDNLIPTITFNSETEIIKINKAAEELYGIKKESVINKTAKDLFTENNKTDEIFKKVLAGETIIHKFKRNNNKEELIQKYIPIKNNDNKTEKILLISLPLT